MGWIVGERPWTGGNVLSHNGSNTMWLAVMWVAPAKDAPFVVATNVAGTDADQGCGEVVSPMIPKLLR